MKAARIISYLFHPLIMPLAGVVILLNTGSWLVLLPPEASRYIYLVVTMTTIILPLSAMPLLKNRSWIHSYLLEDKKERRIPLLVGAFFYLAGAFVLQQVHAPMIFSLFLNASSMIILLMALLTWKWKISNHMAAMGSLTGLILALSYRWLANMEWVLIVLFLLTGVIGMARLKLNTHRPFEIYAGYLIGFTVSFLLIRFI